MTFDLSTEQNRAHFRDAIIASDPDAFAYVATLATLLRIHYTQYTIFPKPIVRRKDDKEKPGTMIGGFVGREFIVHDSDIAWTVWQWQRLLDSDLLYSAKVQRAQALLIIASNDYSWHDDDTVALQNDSSIDGDAIATRTILRTFDLHEQIAQLESVIDACYVTFDAARGLLGLSIRESSYIPVAIRTLKQELADLKTRFGV